MAGDVASQDRKTIIIGAWLLSSIALDFSTRYLTFDLGYSQWLLLSCWQAACLLGLSQAANLVVTVAGTGRPSHSLPGPRILEIVMPIVTVLGSLPLLIHATAAILPEWHQVLVIAIVPVITAIGSRLSRQQRLPKRKAVFIVSMCIAVCFAMLQGRQLQSWQTHLESGGSLEATARLKLTPATLFWIGMTGGVLSIISLASSYLLSERALHQPVCLPVNTLVAYYAPGAFALAVMSAMATGSVNLSGLLHLPREALLANGLVSCLKFYSTFALIKMTSATTVALVSMLQAGFTSLLAGVVYNVPIGPFQAISFYAAFIGFAKYVEKEFEQNRKSASRKQTAEAAIGDQEGAELMAQLELQSDDERPRQTSDHQDVNTDLLILLAGVLIGVLVIASMTATPSGMHGSGGSKPWDNSVKAYNDTRVATIIETRNLPHLIPLLLQFLTILPDNWPVLVWGSRENVEVLKQSPAIVRSLQSGRLNITLFPDEFDIQSQEYLSRFLTKPWFWQNMPGEWILFFQSDSMLCSKSPDSIENWLGFDWVGAPWEDRPDAQGGNGGLSLRKRSSLIRLTNDPDVQREDDSDPEDVWFSRNLGRYADCQWPTKHQGRFSVENYWESMQEWAWKPLGVHSGGDVPPDWRNKDVMARLSEWCPELKIFYDPLQYLT